MPNEKQNCSKVTVDPPGPALCRTQNGANCQNHEKMHGTFASCSSVLFLLSYSAPLPSPPLPCPPLPCPPARRRCLCESPMPSSLSPSQIPMPGSSFDSGPQLLPASVCVCVCVCVCVGHCHLPAAPDGAKPAMPSNPQRCRGQCPGGASVAEVLESTSNSPMSSAMNPFPPPWASMSGSSLRASTRS